MLYAAKGLGKKFLFHYQYFFYFYSCSASLLQMLSRGVHMNNSALDRISPLLSVFCTLFSHSLITLHDADFHKKRDFQTDDEAQKSSELQD